VDNSNTAYCGVEILTESVCLINPPWEEFLITPYGLLRN